VSNSRVQILRGLPVDGVVRRLEQQLAPREPLLLTALDTPGPITPAHDVVLADTTGGAYTQPLPDPAEYLWRRLLVKVTAGGSNFTVSATSIDGAGTYVVGTAGATAAFYSDGAVWLVVT